MSTHTDAEGVNHRARAGEAYRLWWQHDANWYQGVAARFGQGVANEINAEAMGKVALHVGQRVARLHGPLPDTGMVARRVFDTKPPSVEYRLTPLGASIIVPFGHLIAWASENHHNIGASRAEFDAAA